MSGCLCKIEQIDHAWVRVGQPCGYCVAWDQTYRTKSAQPLKDYHDRLERKNGGFESQCPDGDGSEEQGGDQEAKGILGYA